MIIQVNNILTKTRQPIEHDHSVIGRHGKIIHTLGDGWVLIEFFKLIIRVKKNIITHEGKKKTIWVDAKLQWYIHEQDFSIVKQITK